MSFGTPTPVFYEITFVLICAMIGAAMGRGPTLLFCLSMVISYALFIAEVGGFRSTEGFVAGLGFGILVMIPTAMGAGVAILIGYAVHLAHQRMRKQK